MGLQCGKTSKTLRRNGKAATSVAEAAMAARLSHGGEEMTQVEIDQLNLFACNGKISCCHSQPASQLREKPQAKYLMRTIPLKAEHNARQVRELFRSRYDPQLKLACATTDHDTGSPGSPRRRTLQWSDRAPAQASQYPQATETPYIDETLLALETGRCIHLIEFS
jgi:hypothetical protein